MAPPVSHVPSGAQTCYRHADRETGVRCTRCDRPICPDCMTAAAVGFQCPECLREGRKSVRQPRTIAGAPVTADSPVTRLLLGVNVGVFLLVFLGVAGGLAQRFAMQPARVALLDEYYRLLTSMFLHQDLLHIAFNMYALMMLGDDVERMLGRWRYIALYFLAGIGGSVATYLFSPVGGGSLGASGAIFGLFGALFVIQKRMRADTSQLLVVLVINLFIGFVVPGIGWRAHLGGLVTGASITAGYVYLRFGRNRAIPHALMVVVVFAALIGLIALRTQQIRELAGR